MSTTKDCGCSKKLANFSDEELINLVVNEIYDFLQYDAKSEKHTKNTGLQFPFIPLGISNRHIHLTEVTFHKLFGDNVEFEVMRPLYQPGEFASKHTLTIVGPKLRSIPNVRILGPLRKYDQVEVSLTDAIFLGINPPVTNSGSLNNAVPLTLVGPNSSVYLEKCAIIANRHIHISEKDAEKHGLKNGDFCKVKISGEKSTVFENVLIRTFNNWKLQIHLDTDDANAANVREETFVEFIGKM
ncbi:MAG: phosphate propanoyltransferase [Ignavibacteriaceae bacterium]